MKASSSSRVLMLFVLLLGMTTSCKKDDDEPAGGGGGGGTSCLVCSNLIGKRWYWNLDRDNLSNCLFFEDFELKSDGFVDVWRIGKTNSGVAINEHRESVAQWDIVDPPQCKLVLHSLDSLAYDYESFSNPCTAAASFSFVRELLDADTFTVVTTLTACDRFDASIFTFTDFEP